MIDFILWLTGLIIYLLCGLVLIFFLSKEAINYIWRRMGEMYSFGELRYAWRIYKRKKSIQKYAYKDKGLVDVE